MLRSQRLSTTSLIEKSFTLNHLLILFIKLNQRHAASYQNDTSGIASTVRKREHNTRPPVSSRAKKKRKKKKSQFYADVSRYSIFRKPLTLLRKMEYWNPGGIWNPMPKEAELNPTDLTTKYTYLVLIMIG